MICSFRKVLGLIVLLTAISGCIPFENIPTTDPVPTRVDDGDDLIVVRGSDPYAFTSGPDSISEEERTAFINDLKARFTRGDFCVSAPRFLGARSGFTVLAGGTDTIHVAALYYECQRNPELEASYFVIDGDCALITYILLGPRPCLRGYTSAEDIALWFGSYGFTE